MLLFSNILPNAINECIKVLQPWTHFLLYSQNSVGVFWPSFEFLLKQDVFCVTLNWLPYIKPTYAKEWFTF